MPPTAKVALVIIIFTLGSKDSGVKTKVKNTARWSGASPIQSVNQSIYLQKQAASETTVHRAGCPKFGGDRIVS